MTPVNRVSSYRVPIRCKNCGRIICYKMSTTSGFVEVKCSKCGKIATIDLSMRRAKVPIHFRRANPRKVPFNF